MECLKDIFEIISGFAAVVAIAISLWTYKHGIEKERKTDTIRKLSEIRNTYFNTKNLEKKDKLKYLNELEFFAIGIKEDIYDIDIVSKMSGSRLIKQYDKWANEFIKERRKLNNHDKAYCEYEEMIKKLKKIK